MRTEDPLNPKGEKILKSMEETYGPEKGEEVFYASQNKGTISGVDFAPGQPFGQRNPSDCSDAESEIGADPGLPRPDLEHPQLHPGTSTPPEPATGAGDQGPFGQRNPCAADAFDSSGAFYGGDVNGGITGGAMQQNWGSGAKWPPLADALPGELSISDIRRDGESFWGQQWAPRDLGPDQK